MRRTGASALHFAVHAFSLWMGCLEWMVGHLENYVRGSLRYHTEDKRVVVGKIVTPKIWSIDAPAVITRYGSLVVPEEPTPYVDLGLLFAAILFGQNAAIRDANQGE